MEKDFREIDENGRESIQREEGTILFAYDDAKYPTVPVKIGETIAGTLTIGTGHTGPDVAVGMKITEDEADKLLDRDLDIVERAIAKLVKVPLNNNQHAVLCSFGFNAGVGALEDSTLLRKLNRGDYEGAGNELLKWTKTTKKVNGKKVKVESSGLKARRTRELALWNTPDGTTLTISQPEGVAEPKATEIADAPVGGILGGLGGLFDIFKPKKIDPITNQPVRNQPISSPFKSGLNWSVIIGFVAMLLALKGIELPKELQENIVVIISASGAVLTWVISTFFRKQ